MGQALINGLSFGKIVIFVETFCFFYATVEPKQMESPAIAFFVLRTKWQFIYVLYIYSLRLHFIMIPCTYYTLTKMGGKYMYFYKLFS